jgi:uncharacterized protein
VIYPDTYLRRIDDRTGFGVFAGRPIPRGAVVWLHDALDQVIRPEQLASLAPLLRQQVDRYAYVDADGHRILCWDHGRYMNHSCDPSTTSIGTMMEIARRDIAVDEELTCEYGLDYVTAGFECHCGAPGCRGGLMPTDAPAVWRRWDAEAAQAMRWAITVPQPVLEAAGVDGPGAWIVHAIRERRSITLPSWADGVPGSR